MKRLRYLLIPSLLLIISGGCYKNEPVPSAIFTFTGTNNFRIPCTVTFINNSVNSFTWEWNFGDDSVSTLKAPIHQYLQPGNYTVALRAYTESRKEWASTSQLLSIKDSVK